MISVACSCTAWRVHADSAAAHRSSAHEANQRKADELGARIVREFIDAGVSARSADRDGLADMNRRLAEHDEHHSGGRAFLHDSLRLLTDAHHAYARSSDADRRLANQAFYTRLDITDDEQLRPRLAEPFATIIREAHEHSEDGGEEPLREHDTPPHVACSRKTLWVEHRRFELLTSSMRTKRATNCANAPCDQSA